jgi:hypothetical protein
MSWSDMISTKFISGHETIQDTGTKTIGRIRGVIFEQLWKIGRIRRVATHLALMFQQQPLSAPVNFTERAPRQARSRAHLAAVVVTR